jgi:single-stranded DNA-binding protein
LRGANVVTLIGNLATEVEVREIGWEEDGKRRTALEVVARRIEFLGGGPRGEEHEGPGADVIPFKAPVAAG